MDRLLIVEGEEDQKFFDTVCRQIGDGVQVKVRVRGERGKQKAIEAFGSALTALTSASKDRVGLVVDADWPHINASDGFDNTRSAINEALQARSFTALSQLPGTSGFRSAANGRPNVTVGAWIMPDNKSGGCLEDFVAQVVGAAQHDRFRFAADWASRVADGQHGGPAFDFKRHHLSKAQMGTWLAWSDPPRMSLGAVASAETMLDPQQAVFQELILWLRHLYL